MVIVYRLRNVAFLLTGKGLTGAIKCYSRYAADEALNFWMICTSKNSRKSFSSTFPDTTRDNTDLKISETVGVKNEEWPTGVTLGKIVNKSCTRFG